MLNASTGEIGGTPTIHGTFNFTAEVADSQGTPATDTQALSITVAPAALVVATATLPDGQQGVGIQPDCGCDGRGNALLVECKRRDAA